MTWEEYYELKKIYGDDIMDPDEVEAKRREMRERMEASRRARKRQLERIAKEKAEKEKTQSRVSMFFSWAFAAGKL